MLFRVQVNAKGVEIIVDGGKVIDHDPKSTDSVIWAKGARAERGEVRMKADLVGLPALGAIASLPFDNTVQEGQAAPVRRSACRVSKSPEVARWRKSV